MFWHIRMSSLLSLREMFVIVLRFVRLLCLMSPPYHNIILALEIVLRILKPLGIFLSFYLLLLKNLITFGLYSLFYLLYLVT